MISELKEEQTNSMIKIYLCFGAILNLSVLGNCIVIVGSTEVLENILKYVVNCKNQQYKLTA